MSDFGWRAQQDASPRYLFATLSPLVFGAAVGVIRDAHAQTTTSAEACSRKTHESTNVGELQRKIESALRHTVPLVSFVSSINFVLAMKQESCPGELP